MTRISSVSASPPQPSHCFSATNTWTSERSWTCSASSRNFQCATLRSRIAFQLSGKGCSRICRRWCACNHPNMLLSRFRTDPSCAVGRSVDGFKKLGQYFHVPSIATIRRRPRIHAAGAIVSSAPMCEPCSPGPRIGGKDNAALDLQPAGNRPFGKIRVHATDRSVNGMQGSARLAKMPRPSDWLIRHRPRFGFLKPLDLP